MTDPMNRLIGVLGTYPHLTIAVSGGVDSLTLATIAGRVGTITVAHAVSPAVPAEATARVCDLAAREGWALHILDAREFADPAYLSNPLNRCYFCKSNLYQRIGEVTDGPIAAGTNTDDLGEYRPGLIAADERAIVHPYLEAQISKAELRAIAAKLDLGVIADLPAQPCLASRVETGIAIRPEDLAFIHRIENIAQKVLPNGDVRCRLTAKGVRVEASGEIPGAIVQQIEHLCGVESRPFLGVAPYRRGSAFLTGATP